MHLVDTNVCILAIAGKEPDASFLREAIDHGRVAISVITVAEFFAKATREEKAAFEKLLSASSLVSVDERVARQAAVYRGKFGQKKRVHLLDCLLAAQAKKGSLRLVTNNVKDFSGLDCLVEAPKCLR